jgi:hypothetical protein
VARDVVDLLQKITALVELALHKYVEQISDTEASENKDQFAVLDVFSTTF